MNPLFTSCDLSNETKQDFLAKRVLEELITQGVKEFCLCPGARNAPLVYPLVHTSQVKIYHWSEERSAAFFALGRIKATGHPVAVVTSSGTAVAELLPAVMEAYYTGLPLVLITADRPRRFRGSGAPQSVEQVGIFSCYTHDMQDLEDEEICDLTPWTRQGPLHLNVCFEEPRDQECQQIRLDPCQTKKQKQLSWNFNPDFYLEFLKNVCFPFVVIGALAEEVKENIVQFLLHLKAPFYAEGISGIREDARLSHLQMTRIDKIWDFSSQYGYDIDGILRIGGIPTARLWRDLEFKQSIKVCSVSEQPFSGLSHANVIHTSISHFCQWAQTIQPLMAYDYQDWKDIDDQGQKALQQLFEYEPQAEPSLIHHLSKQIPEYSKIYLGNSLPIREWDRAATYQAREFKMASSRGVNGIDGQMATFLGYSSIEQENWSILGDLTVLYDLVAPWVTPQLTDIRTNVIVVNNGGGKIFARMFAHPAFQNMHQLHFQSFAEFWKWEYERWEHVPSLMLPASKARLIELVPDFQATERFLMAFKEI